MRSLAYKFSIFRANIVNFLIIRPLRRRKVFEVKDGMKTAELFRQKNGASKTFLL